MNEEVVVSLIKDLTAKLSAVAEEFSGRVDRAETNEPSAPAPAAPDNLSHVKRLIAERRSRRRFLPAELFHEPAWDMLLALYVANEESQTMNVKGLVACADAPVTTSQRWIEHLAKLRLVTRVVDTVDRRRVEVSLSQTGIEAIEAYLAAHR
ncbi:hypothetical protein ASG67_09060 [Sphingomonas sp. Leaf339]|uniref:hypothetical protein n=1 Tax=Sphingomonas sp. Leaf339 TaxID=1736343 RepID=UPI0006FF1669|nr:hypothetical protein [Sphingomonas sp. Leaf339]KQU52997.1 hypothetical protein ASG67_09060 [Sphingomonas sp. Leaf339]